MDREGREEPVAAEPRNYGEFSLSPDGTQVAVRVTGEDTDDLWIYDLLRDTSTRLTFDPARERFPRWTPDGQRVAFGSAEGMFWKSADGTGEVEPLAAPSNEQDADLAALQQEGLRPEAFSPDGTVLVFQDLSQGRDLGMMSLEGERVSTLLLDTEFQERNAEISPDGRYLVYESDESGQFEVYVRPFPDVNDGKWQVSSEGGTWPFWAADGRELFYSGPQEMMVVAIEAEPTFTLGRREPLFDMQPYARATGTSNFSRRVAISPDGEQFLMLKANAGAPEDIVVVLNWFEELKRLVPTE